MLRSYLSPKIRKGVQSSIHNKAVVAISSIKKGEIIAIKGGHVIDRATLRRLENVIDGAYTQIEQDMFVAPIHRSEREASMIYLNHSCDPNCGVRGQITFVAMRSIKRGEELTIDYAMTDSGGEAMTCNCGSPSCRSIIRGADWKKPELQRKYRGYFSSYLAEKIARSNR